MKVCIMKEIDTMDMRTRAWLFIAYEMYVLNKSKEDLDNMGNLEMDEFERWWKEQPSFPFHN